MATLTIRGLDDETRDRLRVRAAEHGRSMEAEARSILAEAVSPELPRFGLGSEIHAIFAEIGGADDLIELLPSRDELPRAPDFDS